MILIIFAVANYFVLLRNTYSLFVNEELHQEPNWSMFCSLYLKMINTLKKNISIQKNIVWKIRKKNRIKT